MTNLTFSTVIVTGGSRGYGAGIAEAFVKAGARVWITGRNEVRLRETANRIGATPFVADVADGAAWDRLMAEVIAQTGRLDVLINNAGGPKPADFRDLSREDWLAAIDMNMLAPIDLIKLTVDQMIERRFGRIVNITSGAVKAPIDILGLSNGARSGLTGFVAGVARTQKLAANNVTINNLLPGAYDTDRLKGTMKGAAEKTGQSVDAVAEARKKTIPAQRFGHPQEFGDTCAFLCSAQAGYMTGQNILTDGGAYAGTF